MPLSSHKAKKIIKDGEVRGKKLTDKQKRYMGFIAGGGKPSKRNLKKGNSWDGQGFTLADCSNV